MYLRLTSLQVMLLQICLRLESLLETQISLCIYSVQLQSFLDIFRLAKNPSSKKVPADLRGWAGSNVLTLRTPVSTFSYVKAHMMTDTDEYYDK